jgi:hypothetical protein
MFSCMSTSTPWPYNYCVLLVVTKLLSFDFVTLTKLKKGRKKKELNNM